MGTLQTFTALPVLNEPFPGMGEATFHGIGTGAHGKPYALLLVAVVPQLIGHPTAEDLAAETGLSLPTRLDGAMLHATVDMTKLGLRKRAFNFWLAERAPDNFIGKNAWFQSIEKGHQWAGAIYTEQTTVLLVRQLPLENFVFGVRTTEAGVAA